MNVFIIDVLSVEKNVSCILLKPIILWKNSKIQSKPISLVQFFLCSSLNLSKFSLLCL